MSKTLIILTFTMLFFGSALELINPEIFEQIDSKTQARQINSGSTNMDMVLREGMGLIEVEKTLQGGGTEQRLIRSVQPQSSDPLDWNVGWEIARAYEAESNGVKEPVTAIFEAWTDDSLDERPPASAFRLVRWN